MSSTISASIEITDGCLNPFSVTAPDQIDPADYYYTDEGVRFDISPFVVSPAACDAVYSCSVTSGERTDLCSISDGATEAAFDPITGGYLFKSIDMENYKPGVYEF